MEENKNITEDMKNRPLIKSRVKDEENDPLGAEREAKIKRDNLLKKSNVKKVKRKEED